MFVGDRILNGYEVAALHRMRRRTLIMARRMLAEPKTAFAGVTLEISFARFKASMVIFKAERVFPFPSFFFEVMVESERKLHGM